MVLHYAVVLYTRLAPYRGFFLLLSYANFYVKARKIYKFFEDGCRGILKASTGQEFINFYGGGSGDFQKLPPAGSDFALRATQGQSQLLKVLTASPKTLSVENRAKSFLEAHTSTQETLCARRERPAFHAGFQIDFISNFGNSIVRGLSFYSLIKFSCIYAMLKRYFQSVS